MRRTGALLLGAACVLAGCGSSASTLTRADRHSRDVFELAAKFEGDAAKLLGSSHEWYSPGTGFYDADGRPRDRLSPRHLRATCDRGCRRLPARQAVARSRREAARRRSLLRSRLP